MGGWHMPWGKHRGDPLNEIPASYLIWLIEESNYLRKDQALEDAILDELADRFRKPPEPEKPSEIKKILWWDDPDTDLIMRMLEFGYKRLLLDIHPDRGGSTKETQRLNTLIDRLRRESKYGQKGEKQ